jgi:hypothetical protein
MPTSFFEEAFSRLFGTVGTVLEIALGNPQPESGPEILLSQHFETDAIIFTDTAHIDIDGQIADQSFHFEIDGGSDRGDDSPLPGIVRRLFHIDGIWEIDYRSPNDTKAIFPKIEIRKASMFSWDDILPQVKQIITHPKEPLSESFASIGKNVGTLIDIACSLAIGRKYPKVRCEYWEGCNVAGDDDERDRIYAHLSKRLLRHGHESFDWDSKPGFFNVLARKLLNIENVERVVIFPYLIVIYISDWGTAEVWGDEIRMIVKKYA